MQNCKPIFILIMLIKKFNKEDGARRANGSLYGSVIGCLLYLIANMPNTSLQPIYFLDLCKVPNELHFQVAQRVLRYVNGIIDFRLKFNKNGKLVLKGYLVND